MDVSCPGLRDFPDAPCRQNLGFMPDGTALWMYVLSAVAFAVFCYGFWQMASVWRRGAAWKRGDWRLGLKRLMKTLAHHRKFPQEPRSGTYHGWVFFGFTVLFIGTVIVAIDADFFERVLHAKLLHGDGYLLYEAVLDAFGVVFLMGLGFLAARRYKERPGHIHPTTLLEQPRILRWGGIGADGYTLTFLILIGLTGFILEATRITLQERTYNITYAGWSFVGNTLSLALQGIPTAALATWYPLLWWTHFALWTTTLAILPWTKLKHIVTSSLNVLLHDAERQSLPELHKPFDLPTILQSGATDMPKVGYATIRDFTWKHRLSLDACTNCGRCEAQCPATAAGRPLSPRKLIQDLKGEMWRDYHEERAAPRNATQAMATEVAHAVPDAAGATTNAGPAHAPRPLAKADGVGAALQEATLWSCTTCRACVTACPVDIEHVDIILEMRRGLVNESRLDENQQRLLVNLTNAGNPYGFPASDRANWTGQLPDGVFVPTAAEKKARGEPIEWLWWVGCSGSYDPRNQKVTAAVATILNAAGVDFAILGTEERCNGDPARRLGEEGRFQQSVMENMATFEQYGVRKVIAQCPHCFNTLQNEYKQFGATLEVVHHTQLIERLLGEGKLKLKEGKQVAITYHDSCYLMRHNGVAEAPRNVLRRANGLPVLEMVQNREQGLCCGAGGANMWYEVKQESTRINVIRAKQAADTGASEVATACPFCLTMMTDGLSLTGQEGKMQARDLAEIVADNLEWTPPAVPKPEAVAGDVGGGGGWSG